MKKYISLRQKTFAILVLSLMCVFAIFYAISEFIFLKRFSEIENAKVKESVERVLNAVSQNLASLDGTTGDYAIWDDSYDFVKDKNKEFVSSSLNDAAFVQNKINFIVYINTSGEIVFKKGYDFVEESPLEFSKNFEQKLTSEINKLLYKDADGGTKGIILLSEGPIFMAARPILTSEGKGPVAGTLVMARYFDIEEVQALSRVTLLSLSVKRLDENLDADFKTAFDHISGTNSIYINVLNADEIAGYSIIKDIYGKEALIIRATNPRDIFGQGQKTVIYFMLVLLMSGAIVTLIVLLLLDRAYLWRLEQITKQINKMGEKADFTGQVYVSGKDELSKFAETINTMLRKLLEAKAEDVAILASVGDGLIFLKPDDKISFLNRAAEFMLGVGSNEVSDSDFIKNIKPKKAGKDILDASFFKHGSVSQIHFTRKDGTTFPVSVVSSEVLANDKNIGTILAFRDITKEWEIDKAKTEFVSLASHQFRTPLASIRWYIDLLLSKKTGTLTEEQTTYVNEILKDAVHMIDLVGLFLDVSKLELGTFAIHAKPIDIVEIAKSVVSDVKPEILTKGISLKENYGKNVPEVFADEKLIRIIFQNLIANSVTYTPEKGTVAIEVNANGTDDHVLIKVIDTGYGIPRSQQSRIFTKLFRADNVVQRDIKGTGLGLYMIKTVVTQMGGKIWFESEEDKGTVFSVLLPVKPSLAAKNTEADKKE